MTAAQRLLSSLMVTLAACPSLPGQVYRDARQLTIVEGTSQIQLGLIAKGVLGRDLWWD